MLPSIRTKYFNSNIVIIVLVVIVTYIPFIVTKNDIVILNKKNNGTNHTVPLNTYEEFFIEHSISTVDAKQSFRANYNVLMHGKSPAWCMECTDEIVEYCLKFLLKDHCCCDARHGTDALSWIPHECYFRKECKPLIGSCIRYSEYRECCCDRLLAEEWSEVFSSGQKSLVNKTVFVSFVLGLLWSWIHHTL